MLIDPIGKLLPSFPSCKQVTFPVTSLLPIGNSISLSNSKNKFPDATLCPLGIVITWSKILLKVYLIVALAPLAKFLFTPTNSPRASKYTPCEYLSKFIFPVKFILLFAIENINISSGGADLETDDSLRERIKLKPTSFSTAGPIAAYRYYTLTAHQDIIDAHIYTPKESPGTVKIIPLLKKGKIPENEVLKLVAKVLSADDIRPFTDKVEVIAPIASNYAINFKWWINKEDDVTIITSSVNKAVEEYKQWQKEKLGRDINPNKLVQLLIQAGAKRVEIVSPIFTKIEKTHIAQDTGTTASYQGVEDE